LGFGREFFRSEKTRNAGQACGRQCGGGQEIPSWNETFFPGAFCKTGDGVGGAAFDIVDCPAAVGAFGQPDSNGSQQDYYCEDAQGFFHQ
jgi:hypothetical protein